MDTAPTTTFSRLLLSDEHRQRLRDDRLWVRERQWARLFNQKMMHCPYLKCKGLSRKMLTTIKEHLIINGRHPNFRIWRVPGNKDSSYEEWKEEF
jgi:hypothetical protein